MEMMGGASYNLKEDNFKSTMINFSPSLRLLWKPDHRLNIGIETTYMMVRKTETEKNRQNLHAKLEALPIYLVFNMTVMNIDMTGGIGISYMKSTISAFNDLSIATDWHYCFNFAIGYSYYFTPGFGAGFETKLFSLSKTDDLALAAYLKLIIQLGGK